MALNSRHIAWVVAGVAAIGLVAFMIARPALAPVNNSMALTTTELRVGATTIVAEVAQTSQERSLGLGGRTLLAEGKGMWFVFEEDGEWGFWMKDTLIPLDILWVAQDGTIVTIAHDVSPSSYPEVFLPSAPVRYVLELPGGYAKKHGIAEGDKIIF